MLVGFEFGDPRRPYIIGSVWSSADKPPPGANDKPDENNLRFIRSRSGHIIRLDDTPGSERIEIIDKDGARRVVIDSPKGKIEVSCDRGDVDISAPSGTVTISAMNISIKATGSVAIKGATVGINDP